MRANRSGNQAFPVSLYASLLVAMLCLVRPDAVRLLQSWGAALQSLPLRAYGVLTQTPAFAAADETAEADVARRRVDRLAARRQEVAARRPAGVPAAWSPRAVQVRARLGGDRAEPTVLVLDVPRAALDAAQDWVTRGGDLVGFLDRRPLPASPRDPLAALARVALLQHRERGRLPRRVPASIAAPGRALRVVVEPSASIDRWPLRCVLPEDPYFAAGLSGAELAVTTSGLSDDPLGPLPPGLGIGTLRVYGYTTDAGRVLPIGLFAEPAVDAAAVDSVVVWLPEPQAGVGAPRPLDDGASSAVRASWLPVASRSGERLFVTTIGLRDAALRSGAALVHGERLLGVLDVAGLGYGTVARFGEPGRTWRVTLLPDDGGPPLDRVAQGVVVARDRARLTFDAPIDAFVRGDLFSGADGVDLPGGLWVGAAERTGPNDVEVVLVDPSGLTQLEVYRYRADRAGEAR